METKTRPHFGESRPERLSDEHRLSDVRRELLSVNEKIDCVNEKVDMINQDLRPVPGRVGHVEEDLGTKTQMISQLEERNKIHSAKLKLLQSEIRYEKMKSDMLQDYMKSKGDGKMDIYDTRGADQFRPDAYGASGQPDERFQKHQDVARYEQASPQQNAAPMSPYGTNDQLRPGPNGGATSPRQRSPDHAAPAANSYEQRLADTEAKSRQYPVPTPKSGGRMGTAEFENMQKQRRKDIYSVYDSTAINPHLWEDKPSTNKKYPFDEKTHPYPGGFLFMRFDDSGYDSVNVALKSQQSICRNAGGYLMGIARKQRIFVYELAELNKQQNWYLTRKQPYQDARMTENAVAAFWFTKKDGAENFFENCHHNRFREPCFPTPNGYEAYYVPLLAPPPMRAYNTFLFIEVLLTPAKRDALQENLTQFEAEMRNDMTRVVPGCQPMVVSSVTGRVIFKPGLFVSPYSKLFISRFESQRDVDEIWRIGMVQALRHKWGLATDLNVWSMTIDDAF